MYDKLSKPDLSSKDVEEVEARMAAVNIHNSGEVDRLQEKQRAAVERSKVRIQERERERESYPSPPPSASVYSDLQDLNFGELGSQQAALPPPIRPTAAGSEEESSLGGRGSLSDYSDYDSSDEETHRRHEKQPQASSSTSRPTSYGSNSARRGYVSVSDEDLQGDTKKGLLVDDDPFADPFADQGDVGTPGIAGRKGMTW